MMESVEEVCELMDAAWCDGVSRCSMERLDALASCVVATQSLVCDKPGSESVMVVSSLLQSVRECGSTVVQAWLCCLVC